MFFASFPGSYRSGRPDPAAGIMFTKGFCMKKKMIRMTAAAAALSMLLLTVPASAEETADAAAETQGYAYELTAIEDVRGVEQAASEAGGVSVGYQAYTTAVGWYDAVANGEEAGISGYHLPMEALSMAVAGAEDLGITYVTYRTGKGWGSDKANGDISGRDGSGVFLEGMKASLTGGAAEAYDLYYRVFSSYNGWYDWVMNGEEAGLPGTGLPIEAVQAVISEKGKTPRAVLESNTGSGSGYSYGYLSDANWQVYINALGAVESGGQVYGKRRYDAYAGAYANSGAEHTCTLGWAQFYGSMARELVQMIYDADPYTFAAIDTQGLIAARLSTDWVATYWNPSWAERDVLIRLISSDIGMVCQDQLLIRRTLAWAQECAEKYTTDERAIMMYCEIHHQGGKGSATRIFDRCAGDYSLDNIMASLAQDQYDYSSDNQVGDARYVRRHTMFRNAVEEYAV